MKKRFAARLILFWLLLLGVIALLPVLSQEDDAELSPTLKTQIEDAVLDVPGMERVLFVTQGTLRDGGEFVEVAYGTVELGVYGYYAEALDVFRVVGETLAAQEPSFEVERVALTPTVGEHSPIETWVVPGDILRMFIAGGITRSDFLDAVESLPGAHQSPGGDDAGSA